MDRTSRKHTFFLILTLALIILISVGVNLLMNLTNFGNTGSMRSGIFVNEFQGIDSSGWYFSADEAQGHSTFFTNLNQTDIDSLLIESRILSGELTLVITQDDVRIVVDLSESEFEMTANEIDVGSLEPGRVEMRLYFTNAQNIDVVASWNDGR